MSVCDINWDNIGPFCVQVNTVLKNYEDAELSCVSQGAHLVGIHSHEEQTALENYLTCVFHLLHPVINLISNLSYLIIIMMISSRNNYFSPVDLWMGLFSNPPIWQWADGSALSAYSNWGPGEPDTVIAAGVRLGVGMGMVWRDRTKVDQFNSICSRPHSGRVTLVWTIYIGFQWCKLCQFTFNLAG